MANDAMKMRHKLQGGGVSRGMGLSPDQDRKKKKSKTLIDIIKRLFGGGKKDSVSAKGHKMEYNKEKAGPPSPGDVARRKLQGKNVSDSDLDYTPKTRPMVKEDRADFVGPKSPQTGRYKTDMEERNKPRRRKRKVHPGKRGY